MDANVSWLFFPHLSGLRMGVLSSCLLALRLSIIHNTVLVNSQLHRYQTSQCSPCRDGDGSGTSWFSRSSIFLIFAAQLFQKLPAEASEAAFDRVIALAQDITEPGTAAAAAVLVLRCSRYKLIRILYLGFVSQYCSSSPVYSLTCQLLSMLRLLLTVHLVTLV